MELIIIIIMIVVSVLNAQNKRGEREKTRTNGPVFRRGNIPNNREQQIASSVRDMEDAVNVLKNKMRKKVKREEEEAYRKQQQERRRMEEAERKRREAEEQRKRALDQKKKQEELRRKQLEKDKKAKEERKMMERFQNDSSGAQAAVNDKRKTTDTSPVLEEKSTHFRMEDYLDPLTASFYPDVEDYLFPTIASFYPDVDVSSFSLQNPQDVL